MLASAGSGPALTYPTRASETGGRVRKHKLVIAGATLLAASMVMSACGTTGGGEEAQPEASASKACNLEWAAREAQMPHCNVEFLSSSRAD